jgi:hypothetical protein
MDVGASSCEGVTGTSFDEGPPAMRLQATAGTATTAAATMNRLVTTESRPTA